MGNINKIVLVCEERQEHTEISILKPVILCTKCNPRLHKDRLLTEDYVKTERFKCLRPSVWKYLYNFVSNPLTDIISLDGGATPSCLAFFLTHVMTNFIDGTSGPWSSDFESVTIASASISTKISGLIKCCTFTPR